MITKGAGVLNRPSDGSNRPVRNGLFMIYDPTYGSVDGVERLEADDEANADMPIEYFNLQGVRVAAPDRGIYIMHQGSKTKKIIIND